VVLAQWGGLSWIVRPSRKSTSETESPKVGLLVVAVAVAVQCACVQTEERESAAVSWDAAAAAETALWTQATIKCSVFQATKVEGPNEYTSFALQ
jgi:hypothetical protein